MLRTLVISIFFISCGATKSEEVHTTTEVKKDNKVSVRETIFAPFEAVVEVPEVSGRIENFSQKIELPSGGVFVEKTNTGLKISIEQAEIKYKDSITDISVFSDTKTDINNTKTVIKWSKFQWFLLLFFIAVVIIFLFRIFKFLS